MLQTIMSFIPLLLLIWLMVKKNAVPSHKALPIAAVSLFLVMVFVFDRNLIDLVALMVQGFLTSWTPILIIWGAILLFKTMEQTGAMDTIRAWLNGITDNRIAQLMIVGWAFPFLIEGASGFGTPAAIAAPLLVGLGFPAMRVAILALIMNSVPVSFGAVGTPTWFGFSALTLSSAELSEIGIKSAIINASAALVIPWIALLFVATKKEVKANWLFVLLSILATVVPYVAVAKYNYEFPSIVGGFSGLIFSGIFAKMRIGLKDSGDTHASQSIEKAEPVKMGALVKASFPLWGTLLILIVTRISSLGLKGLLTLTEPHASLSLGGLGTFTISPALVVGLKDILYTEYSWSHKLLYVPSLVPFMLISLITFWVFKSSKSDVKAVFGETTARLKNPALALFAALIFVKFMMSGGDNSPVALMGNFFTDVTGKSWQFFAAYLGALGSFFSGSNTVSNLTFAGIQDSISGNLGLNRTTILALQSAGGAMGNMVCINNIVAVCSILALQNSEGYILKRTSIAMVVYGVIAGGLSYLL
ncbi:MAG: L-lactate permease [Fibrobacterales bacterium]